MSINPFLHKDPLVEAVQNAQREGHYRRQAEALVNEAFDVYSRKAVVNEHLAAYDKAVEEVYAQLKEGMQIDEVSKGLLGRYIKKASHDVATKSALTRGHAMKSDDARKNEKYMDAKKHDELSNKMFNKSWKRRQGIAKAVDKITNEELAKKDYDKDGKVESPKDEVWGSRLRAAKNAGKLREEEQLDELSYETVSRYHRKAAERFHTGEEPKEKRERGRQMATRKRAGGMMGIPRAKVMAKEEVEIDEMYEPITGKRGPKNTSDRKRKAVQMALGKRHQHDPEFNTRTNKQHAALKLGRQLQKQGVTKEEVEIDEAKDSYAAYQRRMNAAPNWSREGDWSKKMKKQEREFMRAKKAAEDRKKAKETQQDESFAWNGGKRRVTVKSGHAPGVPKKPESSKPYSQMSDAEKEHFNKYTDNVVSKMRSLRKEGVESLDEAPIGKKPRRGVARSLLARLHDRQTMKEAAQIDEIVVQPSQIRKGETLGMAMNRLTGKTAIKGGDNDATKVGTSAYKATQPETSSTTQWKNPGSLDYSKSNMTPKTNEPVGPEAPQTKTASWHPPMQAWSSPKDVDQKSTIAAADGTNKTATASTAVATKPDVVVKNKQNREAGAINQTVSESVQVGNRSYRIV